MPKLTKRQQEALDWLPTVGHAGPRVCKRHGFSLRTLDALAGRGLIAKSYIGGGLERVPLYRPLRQEPPDA